MASTTTQRRKAAGAPKSSDGVVQVSEHINTVGLTSTSAVTAIHGGTSNGSSLAIPHSGASPPNNTITPIATVRRNKCGTSPFDENWLNMDCCGLFCAGITYMLHMYGVYAVCIVLLPPWMSITNEATGVRSLTLMGHFHRLAFTFVAVMAIYAHVKAMTTDPGAVPPDAMPLEEAQQQLDNPDDTHHQRPPPQRKGKRLCRRCNAFKPKRAHHCSVCQRCIIKMDRTLVSAPIKDHCPWVNNCVGIGNHKYFLLFVFYTFLSCVYSLSLVVTRFIGCMHRHGSHYGHHRQPCLDRPTQLLLILGLVVEALLFGMFTACMMLDQVSVVTSKMTHIDRLKNGPVEEEGLLAGSGGALAGVVEVFGLSKQVGVSGGTRFRPDWLSPFAKACFPDYVHDEIMGFCRPCTRSNGIHVTNLDADLAASINSQMIRSVTEIV